MLSIQSRNMRRAIQEAYQSPFNLGKLCVWDGLNFTTSWKPQVKGRVCWRMTPYDRIGSNSAMWRAITQNKKCASATISLIPRCSSAKVTRTRCSGAKWTFRILTQCIPNGARILLRPHATKQISGAIIDRCAIRPNNPIQRRGVFRHPGTRELYAVI